MKFGNWVLIPVTGWMDYGWPVSRSIQGGVAGLLKRVKRLGYGSDKSADPFSILNFKLRSGLDKFFGSEKKSTSAVYF